MAKWFVVILFTALVVFTLTSSFHNKSVGSTSAELQQASSPDSEQSNYHPSDELFSPYEISKNPYKLKGHSGILDTIRVPIFVGNGKYTPSELLGNSVVFERMIDEHTAIYSVIVGQVYGVVPDGEIAVLLSNSSPPDSTKPWRVYLEGSTAGTNALGASVNVSTVRFEGYYVPSPETSSPASSQPSKRAETTVELASTKQLQFRAMSDSARSITGDIGVFEGVLLIGNAEYKTSNKKDLDGDNYKGAANLLSIESESSAAIALMRVHIPSTGLLNIDKSLCGGRDAEWVLASAQPKQLGTPTKAGSYDLTLGFLSGEDEPDFSSSTTNRSRLCDTFVYEKTP